MGNDLAFKRQVESFNRIWKEVDPNFALTPSKMREIQKLIVKEYPFLKSIHESMLVTSNTLKDNPIIFQNSSFTDMTQYTENEILGNLSIFFFLLL